MRLIDADALLEAIDKRLDWAYPQVVADLITNAPTVEQDSGEAVAYAWKDDKSCYWINGTTWAAITYKSDVIPLYTSPPKREWVDLTDEQCKQCWNSLTDTQFYLSYAEAIQAKLKELNT